LLATGLVASAALICLVGGGWGYAIGAVQAALAVAIVVRRGSLVPVATAVAALAPPPLAATRHWTARLPGACRCARLPHPPPGLVSVTGLAVALDLALLGLTLWLMATNRTPEVGKSRL
jgi:hypothetical protein